MNFLDGTSLYVNPIWWLVALAGVVAWARAATWISHDVHESLREQSELMWRIVVLATLLVMILVWLVCPVGYGVPVIINFLLVAGVVAWYWIVRVKELGSAGHLFRGAIQAAGAAKQSAQNRRAARQVTLTYLRKDDSAVPLPRPDDPSAAGLQYADQVIVEAVDRRADQIELSPAPSGYELKYIVDGFPYPQAPMGRNMADPLIQAIKMLAGLAIEERRRPQEGLFKIRSGEGTLTTWTVRTSGTTAGERVSLTANEKGRWNMTLDQLGFTADQLAQVRKLADPSELQGVVLVASPRQSGRTATLYALLRQHDAFTTSVYSVEANPQAEIEGVTVNRFDPRAQNASWAKLLQSTFLKDPGVTMSAQVPDAASAEAIARFAYEEHRVYAGMPANDTMAAMELWMQLIRDKKLAIGALRGIMSQRLVRILCPTCKIPYQPDEATLRKLNLPVGRNLQSFKANTEGIVDQKGNRMPCPDCGSIGYRGRTGIFEVLIITDDIRKAVLEGASIKQVHSLARKNNMMLLVEAGIRKFAVGLTSINEVLRVVAPDKGNAASAGSGMMPAQR